MKSWRRSALFLIVMMFGVAVPEVAATSASAVGSPQPAVGAARPSTAVVSDPVGDNGPGLDPRGDLVAVSVRDDGTTITLGGKTRQFDNPSTSPNWIAGGSDDPILAAGTYLGWELELNGNANTIYWVSIQNDAIADRRVTAYLQRFDDLRDVICAPTVRWNVSSGYSASFPTSCLGRPNKVRVTAFMGYLVSLTASNDHTAWTSTVFSPGAGYWMVGQAGSVYAFGPAAGYFGSASTSAVTHLEPTPTGHGYWIVNASGQVFPFGDARWLGNAGALASGETVTSMSSTPLGGYWLFTNRGRVFPFGDAQSFGDMSGTQLNGPVVGSVATLTGHGYYMVASDGGIFTFGDARFHGSMGGTRLNKPVTGLVPTSDNRGYWLVASDGGIFAFNAPFRGSMGNAVLNQPVIGMVRYGNGYLMVASDGGIFDFSNEPFAGSLGSQPPDVPIVGVAATG